MLNYCHWLFISFFITCCYSQLHSQNCELKHDEYFPYVRQSNSSLCWGASLEMVLRYWQPDTSICDECSQEDIKCNYLKKVKKPVSSQVCSLSTPGLSASFYLGNSLQQYRDFYSAILAYYGLNSIQMVNGYPISLSEELIKEEICNCRPLILIFDKKDYSHVVVLKSYVRNSGSSNIELHVYDPLDNSNIPVMYITTATGSTPIIDIDDNIAIATIQAFLYGIEENDKKNKGNACRPCTKLDNNYDDISEVELRGRIPDSSAVNVPRLVGRNRDRLPYDKNYKLSVDQFAELICSGNGYFYPLVELSKKDFANIRKLDFTVSNSEIPMVFEYVMKVEGQQLIFTFYRSNENESDFSLYKIRAKPKVRASYFDEQLNIKLDNRRYCSNEIERNQIPFTVINVPSIDWNFYQYEYNGKLYLRPIEDIEIGQERINNKEYLLRRRDYRKLERLFLNNNFENPTNNN